MGRKIRYTGRKQKPFTEVIDTGEQIEVTPGEILDLHPLIALRLLRSDDYEPVRGVDAREEQG